MHHADFVDIERKSLSCLADVVMNKSSRNLGQHQVGMKKYHKTGGNLDPKLLSRSGVGRVVTRNRRTTKGGGDGS